MVNHAIDVGYHPEFSYCYRLMHPSDSCHQIRELPGRSLRDCDVENPSKIPQIWAQPRSPAQLSLAIHYQTFAMGPHMVRDPTVGSGIVNNWLWANLHFWDFEHFCDSARIVVLSG